MTKRARKPDTPATAPAGQLVELAVNVLTDGVGRYYLPVFVARPDGGADFVGLAVYDQLEDALRATSA